MLLLIYALLGLALVIAVLGIVNTLALSVIERTREVGLLRAIGLGRSQPRRMIRLEAIAIAVLGAVLGVGMGLVFGLALMASLADEGLEVITVPTLQLVGYVLAAGVRRSARGGLPGPTCRAARRAAGDRHGVDRDNGETLLRSPVAPPSCPHAEPRYGYSGKRAQGGAMGDVATPDRPRQTVHKHVQVREYVRGLIQGAEPGSPAPSSASWSSTSASPG